MLSELVIAGTLVVNAGAVLNFKLAKGGAADEVGFDSPLDVKAEPTIGDKVREFLINLRYFRIFIGVWNILVILCMLILFSA